jgi:hypothetical protein
MFEQLRLSPKHQGGFGTMKKIVAGLILVLILSAAGFARQQKTSPDTKQELTSPEKAEPTRAVGNVINTNGRTVSGTTEGVGQTLNGVRLSQASSVPANGSIIFSARNKNLRFEKGLIFQLRLSQPVEN